MPKTTHKTTAIQILKIKPTGLMIQHKKVWHDVRSVTEGKLYINFYLKNIGTCVKVPKNALTYFRFDENYLPKFTETKPLQLLEV